VDDKLTVVVLTNGDNANPNSIAIDVAAFYIAGLIPERTAKKIDPRVLDTYAGQYQPTSSTTWTVAREGDKLVLQPGSNSEKQSLLPETDTNFFTNENRRLTYSFIKDENGQVTHLAVLREGRELGRAKKVK
jgi:hypothetical protein